MKLYVIFWVSDVTFTVNTIVSIKNFQVKDNKDKCLFNGDLNVDKQVVVIASKDK